MGVPGSLAQDYTLQVQRSVTVQEGLCVSIRCTFSYPRDKWTDSDSELVYWFKKGPRNFETKNEAPVATNNSEKDVKRVSEGRFQLLRDPGVNSCSLSITDARKEDGGTYFFRVERGKHFKYSYRDPVLTVNVTALTQVPDIIITEPLESGRPSLVTCSVPGACDRGTPLTFSWTGAALWSQGSPLGVYNSSAITLTPGPQDHGTNLTCRVTFPRIGVTTERTVTLNVSYAPQNLTISFLRGDCAGRTGAPSSDCGGSSKFLSSLFSLLIPPLRPNLKYQEYLGNTSSPPVMEEESLCLVCVAVSNPPATMSWTRDNCSLSLFQSSDSGVLMLPRIQEENDGEVTCRAQNPLGSQHVTLRLSTPPELFGPSCSWEAEGLHCSCSARALLAPSLRWRVGDPLVEGNSSEAAIMVTSTSEGPWANSSLSLCEGLSSDFRLHCEARNAHGAHRVTVFLLPVLSPELEDSQGHQEESQPDSTPDDPPLAVTTSTSGEDQEELHYASLIFQGQKPSELQEQEATRTTEYSEIRIRPAPVRFEPSAFQLAAKFLTTMPPGPP
ncbi:sialic acid-binding Ig-like lectin 11 [Rhynchocyon petersi]